jgi:glucose-6-phosphate dehydrogenase assembly protein OpcA
MSTTLAPDSILRELAEMWVDLGKQHEAPGPEGAPAGTPEGTPAAGVLRACSLTLVVVAAGNDDPAALGETLAALVPQHPARTIVIRLGGNEPAAARVTAQCWVPFGQRRQICCEQIEITASQNALDDVASVVSPIAAPDLPLVLWCRSPRVIDNAHFGYLAKRATKVLVDTAGWPDARGAIRKLSNLAAGGLAVGDFSWTRLTRWREMLSQLFENRRYAGRLAEISTVHIVFGGTADTVLALYMGAWLVDSLASAGVSVKLNLEPDASLASDLFSRVELSGPAFQVELARRKEQLVITVDGLSHCMNLSAANDYVLASEELEIVRHDPVFERTLASAARL